MKRIFFWALSLLFLLEHGGLPAQAQKSWDDSLPLDAHMTERYRDDLPGLLKKRYIRVLTTLNRTNFYLHDGRFVGYEYSLLKGYEAFLNKLLGSRGLNIVFEFIPVTRDELIPRLMNGFGDIAAAGLTITKTRQEKVAFSQPYLSGIDEVVVTGRDGFQPDHVEDLGGRNVYVRRSSSYYQSLVELNEQLTRESKEPIQIIELSEELETEDILEMVDSGVIGITVADSHIAQAWSQVLENIDVHESLALRRGAQVGWMVRKENPKLLASINDFLKTHRKGTLLGNIYFNRYYKDAQKLKNPLKEKKWEKTQRYKEIIKKYAQKYQFDWLLILAMAYQESGLDHQKKSKAGAVGLMQVLPSTARDKNVDIQDVGELDDNVHAGVKYLAFLRDRYFNAEDMFLRDKVRMSLAAYNAGPAKIRRARQLAWQMGLNGNRWFRNVELAVLSLVGQETVRYVSNINKYYVLYQQQLDEQPILK